jgi:hypothetical protein
MFNKKNEIRIISGDVKADCERSVGSKKINKEQGRSQALFTNNSNVLGMA